MLKKQSNGICDKCRVILTMVATLVGLHQCCSLSVAMAALRVDVLFDYVVSELEEQPRPLCPPDVYD